MKIYVLFEQISNKINANKLVGAYFTLDELRKHQSKIRKSFIREVTIEQLEKFLEDDEN